MNLWEEQAPAPARRRPKRLVLGVLTALALLAPTAAWASHDFNDVPDGNPFHDQISWMAGTGITGGFGDGGFHPSDPVSRQAMAAFMQRNFDIFAGLTEVTSGSDGGDTTAIDTWTNLGISDSITIPPGTKGRIVATFSSEVFCNNGDNTFAFVVFRASCKLRLVRGTSSVLSPSDFIVVQSLDAASDGDLAIDGESMTIQATTPVLNPGTHTIKVQGMADDADGNANDKLILDVGDYLLRLDVILQDS